MACVACMHLYAVNVGRVGMFRTLGSTGYESKGENTSKRVNRSLLAFGNSLYHMFVSAVQSNNSVVHLILFCRRKSEGS